MDFRNDAELACLETLAFGTWYLVANSAKPLPMAPDAPMPAVTDCAARSGRFA